MSGTTAAFAARDICNGVYEIDGCEYCSRNGSASASSSFYCDYGYSGYYWSGCNIWAGICVNGSLPG